MRYGIALATWIRLQIYFHGCLIRWGNYHCLERVVSDWLLTHWNYWTSRLKSVALPNTLFAYFTNLSNNGSASRAYILWCSVFFVINYGYADIHCGLKTTCKVSLSRGLVNRVLAPEGELTLQKPSLVFALRVDTKSAPGGFVGVDVTRHWRHHQHLSNIWA